MSDAPLSCGEPVLIDETIEWVEPVFMAEPSLERARPRAAGTRWREMRCVGFAAAGKSGPTPAAVRPPATAEPETRDEAPAAAVEAAVRRDPAARGRRFRLAAAAMLAVMATLAYPHGIERETVRAAIAPNPGPAAASPTTTSRAASYLARAEAGDPAAQYAAAVLYATGSGVARDPAAAAGWFRKSAQAGNVVAQYDLGVLYQQGAGVRLDAEAAAAWYKRAAARDDAKAEYNLGLAYDEGRGVPRDPVAAARWYHDAAEQGIVPAMVNFAILYENGDGVERSPADAYAWYAAAAERGDAEAKARAAVLLSRLTPEDVKQAQELAASVADSIGQPEPAVAVTAAPARSPAPEEAPAPVLKSGIWAAGRSLLGGPAPHQPPG